MFCSSTNVPLLSLACRHVSGSEWWTGASRPWGLFLLVLWRVRTQRRSSALFCAPPSAASLGSMSWVWFQVFWEGEARVACLSFGQKNAPFIGEVACSRECLPSRQEVRLCCALRCPPRFPVSGRVRLWVRNKWCSYPKWNYLVVSVSPPLSYKFDPMRGEEMWYVFIPVMFLVIMASRSSILFCCLAECNVTTPIDEQKHFNFLFLWKVWIHSEFLRPANILKILK